MNKINKSNTIHYYRIVSKTQIEQSIKFGHLRRCEDQPPYNEGEVVFMFMSNDIIRLHNETAETMAELMSLNSGDKLYFLRLSGLDKAYIEIDKSQSGWPHSRAYRGEIDLESVSISAYCDVIADAPGMKVVSNLVRYDVPIPISEFAIIDTMLEKQC